MGRPKDDDNGSAAPPLTVGVYGIGMKRAIFKMGRESGYLDTEQERQLSRRDSRGLDGR